MKKTSSALEKYRSNRKLPHARKADVNDTHLFFSVCSGQGLHCWCTNELTGHGACVGVYVCVYLGCVCGRYMVYAHMLSRHQHQSCSEHLTGESWLQVMCVCTWCVCTWCVHGVCVQGWPPAVPWFAFRVQLSQPPLITPPTCSPEVALGTHGLGLSSQTRKVKSSVILLPDEEGESGADLPQAHSSLEAESAGPRG